LEVGEEIAKKKRDELFNWDKPMVPKGDMEGEVLCGKGG
jgi:hypothetical protein